MELRESLLRKVEKFLHKNARKRGGISDETEMKMWLVNTIGNLPSSSNIFFNFTILYAIILFLFVFQTYI